MIEVTYEVNTHGNVKYFSDLSRDFLGIPFPAGGFRAGVQNDMTVNFEEQLSVINMYGWHG